MQSTMRRKLIVNRWAGRRAKAQYNHRKEWFSTKRSCKDIDLRNWRVVLPWVRDCILRHKRRHDFRNLLKKHGMSLTEYFKALDEQDNTILEPYIINIAKEAVARIAARELNLPPVRIRVRYDHTTMKERLIGDETPMQQVFDYIVVWGTMPVFKRRLVIQQASSIKGRGQNYGVGMIRHWVKADNKAIRWAKKHKRHYSSKCKWHVKMDAKKCYPSADMDIFLNLLRRDCANEDVLWLWEILLSSHRVGGYKGFMIGALPSQWAVQYMFSFAYRHLMNTYGNKRRGKRQKLASHSLIFMDDILITGTSRKNLILAANSLTSFAKQKLGFTLKSNWHIKNIDVDGIDMMGFVIHRNGKITLRARNFIHSRRLVLRYMRVKRLHLPQARRVVSYKGFYDHSDTKTVVRKLGMSAAFKCAAKVVSDYDRRLSKNGEGFLSGKTK